MAVVGVQVAAGGLNGGMAEDVLEDVQRDARVGHPGGSGVAEAVPGEIGQAEIADDLVSAGSSNWRVAWARPRNAADASVASATGSSKVGMIVPPLRIGWVLSDRCARGSRAEPEAEGCRNP